MAYGACSRCGCALEECECPAHRGENVIPNEKGFGIESLTFQRLLLRAWNCDYYVQKTMGYHPPSK